MKNNDNTTPHSAAEYDVAVRKTIPFYEEFHKQTLDLIKTIKPDVKSWLDTGCGTGYTVEEALKEFSQTRFTMADPSSKMLEMAKERLLKYKDKITFINSPTEELQKSLNSTFDVITAIQSHLYMDEKTRIDATKNCFNLLDDGGLYITFENICPSSDEAVKIGLERWKSFQVASGRSASVAEEHAKRFNTAYFPITITKHLSLLQKTGFRVYEILWYSHMQAGFYALK